MVSYMIYLLLLTKIIIINNYTTSCFFNNVKSMKFIFKKSCYTKRMAKRCDE